jgi:hypothetical protein
VISARPIATLRRHRTELRWSLPVYDAGVGSDRERRSPVADVVDDAVRVRARASRARGERMLRRLGVRIVSRGAVHPPAHATETTDAYGAASASGTSGVAP